MYVALPHFHMAIHDITLQSFRGPKENRHRPFCEYLFRSAARAYGPNAIGVILSGSLDEGTVGLWDIKSAGGIAIVQSPVDARFNSTPRNAIENVNTDYVVPVSEIASIVNSLVTDSVHTHNTTDEETTLEKLTDLTCPESRGPLHELKLGRVAQLECRAGHCYSPESALAAHEDTEERTLWSTVVALEGGADFAPRLVNSHMAAQKQNCAPSRQKNAHTRR